MRKVIFFLLIAIVPLMADPWGKDADLVRQTPGAQGITPKCETPVLGVFAEIMIGFHQNVISPVQGPRSHFIPSSSHYTLDAMRQYGFLKGFVLGCDRLMRENSDKWVYRTQAGPDGFSLKYDPVPEP